MAWSYRNDRSDEIYAKTTGPSAAPAETLPRPPTDGEDVDNVLNPPVAEEKKLKQELDEARPKDPEAGPPPPVSLEGIPPEVIQEKKLGPKPPPTVEEQQRAIEMARGEQPKQEQQKAPATAKK